MSVEVSVSVLGADLTDMRKFLSSLDESDTDMLHFDVMDGVFVPNLSYGMPVLKDMDRCTDLFMDVHLMINDPAKYVKNFAESGADLITFHAESKSDISETIKLIKSLGIKAGISIKPATPVSDIEKYLSDIDLVLVMTVEPGFGGQSFMEDMIPKIKELDKYRKENNLTYKIEVDGGINNVTGKKCADAGADVLVSGSYVLKSENMKEKVTLLKSVN
ncbi:MAG: ribulose-phosphate 3-epimerase [Oscillospiraceae bacterium]|nr:ribulose-phosphate 3-epimerase [Oscillospiraceae bacterium]MDD6084742.1 ribulose-phosphate 3-epimerase [Oscillospiraceae bacterium]MDY3257782.1 ribulose-phosphate 3-epimerase [Ruminococcus callidus]